MALKQSEKRFKQFEREISSQEVANYRAISGYFTFDGKVRESWLYTKQKRSWSPTEVRAAVYEAKSAYEWQKFRMALKGLSIHEKLCALELRWKKLVRPQHDLEVRHVEQCRIDNYLNALARSGDLMPNGYVPSRLNKPL